MSLNGDARQGKCGIEVSLIGALPRLYGHATYPPSSAAGMPALKADKFRQIPTLADRMPAVRLAQRKKQNPPAWRNAQTGGPESRTG